jgi:restriction endonuclease S subunit
MPDSLKKGWTRVAFGDVVERVDESGMPTSDESRTYIGLEHLDTDSFTVNRWGSVVDLVVPKTRIKKGDVLFARRNTHLKRCAIAPFDTYFSPDGYAFRSKSPALLQDLLLYIVASDNFMNFAIEHSAGTHSKRVKWEDIVRYEFELPTLEEQRRIAEVLGSTSELSDYLANCANAVAEILSAMTFAFFSRMHNDNNVEKRPLSDLLAEDICNGIFRKREQFGSGMRMINVTDCYLDFEVSIDRLERVPVNRKEYDSFSARAGDVIFNRSSLVLSGIGHACMVPDTEEEMVFECHLMRVRSNVNEINSRYLTHYALSPYGRKYLLTRAQTTTMTTINQDDLRNMPIPCPPIDMQKQLAKRFDQVLSLKRLLLSKRYLVTDLTRFFTRKLLVSVDSELT